MEYKVLYRKYRPNCFKNIVGQEYTIKMLQNAIIHDKISHAYLFTGPRGTGKTSTAKVFAKTINCLQLENGEACGKCSSCLAFEQSPDIIEIDAASNNGVDDIRELINNVKIAPTEGKYKIYIIDEVHMMTSSAFNALLLTLEEPPAHAIFIMATTNVESVPITILSRCQRFNFRKFSIEDLKKQIFYICKEENIKITDEACTEIAYLSEGGMRDALSLLDQLASNEEEITIDSILVNYGSISVQFIRNIIKSLEEGNVLELSKAMEELQNTSSDYKIFIKKMIQELSHLAVRVKLNEYNGSITYNQIKNIIFEFNECMNKININVNPYLLIEMILLQTIKLQNEEKIVDNSIKNEEQTTKIQTNVQQNINPAISEKEKTNEANDISLVEEDNTEYLKKLKEIRVNNCFVNAKKDFLLKHQQIWKDLKENYDDKPEIMSLIMDTSIVASSDVYCILSAKLESTANLVNNQLDLLTEEVESFFDTNVHFICLTEKEWNDEKKIYVDNLKKGQRYELMDEKKIDELRPKAVNEIDEFATNIFSRDKIEIV